MVEVCAKILYQVELQRGKTEHMWGFSVEAELIENADRQDELCCYVSRVEDKSVAMQNGNYLLHFPYLHLSAKITQHPFSIFFFRFFFVFCGLEKYKKLHFHFQVLHKHLYRFWKLLPGFYLGLKKK